MAIERRERRAVAVTSTNVWMHRLQQGEVSFLATRLGPRFWRFVARLGVAVAMLATAAVTTAPAAHAAAPWPIVTVAVQDGVSLDYFDVPADQVAAVEAATPGDIVAVSVPGTVYATDTPPVWPSNDEFASVQWAIPAAGFDLFPARAQGAGITVAVIDTGVRADHEDMTANLTDGGDYVKTAGPSQTLVDRDGHGTHVAGIIAARFGNGIGIAGAAPAVHIVAYRVLDDNGSGTDADIARAVTAATDAGVKIINLSLGGDTESAVMTAAISNASTRGVLVVASAGNDGEATDHEVGWPASDPNVIAVGATTPDHVRASFSSYGPEVDLAAPGYRIASTYSEAFDSYWYMSGTSMAAPYVAAAAADIWSAHPQATAAQVRQALQQSATDLGKPGVDVEFGYGQVNMQAALANLDAMLNPPENSPPQDLPPSHAGIALDHFTRTFGTNNFTNPEQFWIVGDQVYHSYLQGGVWSPDSALGGPSSGIRSLEVGNELNYVNNAELYVVANDGQVYHDFATPGRGSGWNGWDPMGAPTVGIRHQVSVGRNYLGNQELYVLGNDGQVYHKFSTPGFGTGWSNWDAMGTPPVAIVGDVHVSRNYLNNQELYALGADGQAWHDYSTPGQGSGWSGWGPLGTVGTNVGDVAVWRTAAGSQELFTVAGGQLLHNWATPGQGSGWSGWSGLGNPGVALVSLVGVDPASPVGVQHVWARDSTGNFWYVNWSGSAWSTWQNTGPTIPHA